MKSSSCPHVFAVICGLSLLAGGCLFKSTAVPTRHFILTPLPPPEHALAATQSSAIEVGDVKMPSYLLGDSMVVRKSATEIELFEDALWGEQLDQGFRRVLEDDLSSLAASRQTQSSTSEHNEATMTVSVNVQRFDVDTQGQGTLLASWKLSEADSVKPVKSGQTHLTRNGPAPHGNPQAIVDTLSALISEFGRQLADVPREASELKSEQTVTVFLESKKSTADNMANP